MFKPVETRRVSEEVALQLRTLIFSREFQPGSQLPPERELAERLHVHRSSLREALKRLESEGLLEIRRGDGLYVRDFLKEANLAALEAFLFTPSTSSLRVVEGIQEFRVLFQCEMARLAASRRTPEDIAAFDTLLKAEADENDPHRFRKLDWEFAQAMARATHNIIYTLVLNSARELHERWGPLYFYVPGTIQTTRHFHRLIVQAITTGRIDRAASLMKRLLEFSNPIIFENVQKSLLPQDTPV